jgi:hypothetical protein
MTSYTSGQRHPITSTTPIATGVIVHDAMPGQPNSSWFSRTWNYLMHHLLRGNEPRIWQKRNAAGDIFYGAYDPDSGQLAHFTSDTELRIWLEQLRYQ